MSNKKINELSSAASLSLTDLLLVGNPSSGFAYKTTLSDFKTWLGVQNIYTNDGTITANRTVTLGGYSLSFAGINSVFKFGTSGVTEFNYGQVLKIQNSWTDGSVVISGGLPTTHAAISVYGTSGGDSNLISFDYSGTRNHSFSSTNNYLNYTSGSTYIGYSSAPTEGYKFQVLGVNNVVFIKGSGTGNYLAVYDSSATPQPLFRIGSDGAMIAPTANDISHRIGNLLFKNSTISGYAPITIGSGADGTDPVYFGTKNIYFTATTAGVSVPTNFNLPHAPNNGTQEGLLLIKDFTNSGAGGTSVYNAFFSKIFAQTSVGNVTINHFGVNGVFNTTAGTTLSRGFYYNATSTSSVGLSHIPFENVNGNNYFNSSSGSTLIGYASGTASSYKLDVTGTSRFASTLRIDNPVGYSTDVFTTYINGGTTAAFKISTYGITYMTNGGTNTAAAYVGDISVLGQRVDSLMLYSAVNGSGITQWTGGYDPVLFKMQSNHTTTSGWFFIVDNGNAGNFSDLSFGGTAGIGMQVDRNLLSLRHAVNSGTYTFGSTPGTQTYTLLNIPIAVAPTVTGKILRGIRYAPSISGTALTNHYAATFASGQVGIGTETPHASAKLDISSTTQGFLPPRLTYAEAFTLAGASPSPGLIIYVTGGGATTFTSEGWWGYTSTGWIRLN